VASDAESIPDFIRPGWPSGHDDFDELGQRKESIRAVSIDMSGGYEKAIRHSIPDAEVCFDPFHVVRLAQRAVDQVRRDEWNAHDRSHTKTGKWIKNTRWSLLKSPEKQTVRQLALLGEVQQANRPMFRVLAQRGATAALPP
jgi:transposase